MSNVSHLMNLPDFSQLVDNKALLSAASALAGGLFGNLIAVLRSRIKTLEYTATHDRIAFSANDAVFGAIQVMWQGHSVTNLYTSRVELSNRTGKDLTDLKVKVYTNDDTLVLGERTEIPGTTHVLKFTDDFAQLLKVPPGEKPSEQQFKTYNHRREYVVPVLNRGQSVAMTYLTNTPSGAAGPSVWLDLLHPGVRVQYRVVVAQVHGVPIRIALVLGLISAVFAFVLSSLYLAEPWAAALVCLVVGLAAQSVGALLFRAATFVKALVVR
jgi:hypothetical protein